MCGHKLPQKSVQLTCRNSCFPPGQGRIQRLHDSVRMPRRCRRNIDARRPRDLHEFAFEFRFEFLLAFLVHQVPLVVDDHECPPGINNLLHDAHVLLGQYFRGIKKDEGDLGFFNRSLCSDRRVEISSRCSVHFAAHTGRIHKLPLAVAQSDDLIDRVTRSASC